MFRFQVTCAGLHVDSIPLGANLGCCVLFCFWEGGLFVFGSIVYNLNRCFNVTCH